jgi:hydroxyacylglutathione hydrolase
VLFERIESTGLAHYSYLLGDQGEALVIDPRRDCQVYLDKTHKAGYRIAHILETHRNEDYVIGSVELAARSGAEIWHADKQFDYRYGRPVSDGDEWQVGGLQLKAIHSPGHTPGSMSYLLYDPDGSPWMVFTGDALFAGDIGRVDLMGMDQVEKMAGWLYTTLFEKILPLGDHVIVCPAHGSGSVCGSSIADRPWTTVGLEKRNNPRLQHTDRGQFVSRVARELERPPYFRRMEEWNVQGPPLLGSLPVPTPMSPEAFDKARAESFVLDTRPTLCFASAHVPKSLSIWPNGVASFAGWYLPYDRPLLLVSQADDPSPTVRKLIRMGYDDLAGHLAGGMLAWHTAGLESAAIETITVQDLCRDLDEDEEPWILDVRSAEELEHDGEIPDAHHIHITQLHRHLEDIPREQTKTIFCGSGVRSMIAASMLQSTEWHNVRVVLGGLSGWNSTSCPLKL